MHDIPFDAIGFDLDGTLVDSHEDLATAVNHALAMGGFDPVPLTSAKDLIGGGAKAMLAKAIDAQGGIADGEFRPLYKTMLGYYADHPCDRSTLYPGVAETIEQFAAAGITMAVVTNKFEGFARPILETLGLASRFEAIIGGDTLGRTEAGDYRAKPLPDPILAARQACERQPGHVPRFVFVGDSSYDVAAARAAGVPVVVAAYGYCDRPADALGGDGVIGSFGELAQTLRSLPG